MQITGANAAIAAHFNDCLEFKQPSNTKPLNSNRRETSAKLELAKLQLDESAIQLLACLANCAQSFVS